MVTRLEEALADAGIRLRDYKPGITYRARCPSPDCRNKRSEALAVTIDRDGNGAVWQCFRCGWTGGVREGSRSEQVVAQVVPPPAKPSRIGLSPFGHRLWRESKPIKPEDPAGRYLKARGCDLPHPDGDMRWHPNLWHPSGCTGPALVALVTDALDASRRMSLHRTWIDLNQPGQKAALDPPRLLLGGHPKAGGVIRLWPDDWVTHGLAVGEGIESCLAAAKRFTPIWATIDAGNLGAFPVVEAIEALTIVCDRDAAGIKATQTCLRRWRDAGREVSVLWPDQPGADWCDVVRRAS